MINYKDIKMKRYSLIVILLLFFVNNITAQKIRIKENKEKIEALKIAFLTEQLELTEKEAQKFWPIYNNHRKTMGEIFKEEHEKIRFSIRKKGGYETLTETEAKQLLTHKMNLEKRSYKEKKDFQESLMSFLPHKKILKLQIAEREFKKQLFERLRRQRHKQKK